MKCQTQAMFNPYMIQCHKDFSSKRLDDGTARRFHTSFSLSGQIFMKTLPFKDYQRLTTTSEKVVAGFIDKIKYYIFALIIPDEPEPDNLLLYCI
ncbi:MAG: hypothetical protein IH597_06395 [Bacteroidales bacterium]|nr:hypothetical protein [Bacteroidales bacterium]